MNFIGSAWKWIAGNPDHEDYEIITNKMNNVLKNNNQQVIINQLYNDKINNITKIVNDINNAIQKESKISDQLILSIQYKIRLMKEEIINIKYAIHWAKAGIINSLILSNSEIKLAIDTIEKENLPYSTPEEALDFSNIKIISNKSCLLYIVYIPLTTPEIFEKLLIKSVKKNNKITEIDYENIIKNHDNIYGIIKNCKTINTVSICKRNNLLDISNSTCLPNLLKSRPSKCNRTNNQHVPTIDELAEGVILLNQFDGNLGIEKEIQKLNGTYLIKFSNTSLAINNNIFTSREKATIQVLPAILQPTPQEIQLREILSVQMIKDLHINNTERIELIQEEESARQIINYSLISLSAIITLALIFICMKNRKIRISNTTTIENQELQTNTSHPQTAEKSPDTAYPEENSIKIQFK